MSLLSKQLILYEFMCIYPRDEPAASTTAEARMRFASHLVTQ